MTSRPRRGTGGEGCGDADHQDRLATQDYLLAAIALDRIDALTGRRVLDADDSVHRLAVAGDAYEERAVR